MVGLGMIFDETYRPFFEHAHQAGLYQRSTGLVEVDLVAAATRTGSRGAKLLAHTNNNEIIEAKLVDADDEKAILNWKERVPKKVGKGKETVEFTKEFLYTDIKEAIITIKF